MKQKILGLLMVFAGMLMSTSIVHAGQPTITATHSIISQQQAANGEFVTLQITITNPGLQTINNLSLKSVDTMFVPNLNPIVVGNIPSSGSVNVQVSGTSPRYSISMPWMLIGSGIDANGGKVQFQILSQGK